MREKDSHSVEGASLGQKVFSNTTFGLVDLIIKKLGTTAVFVLLVRLLEPTAIAAIGVASGYLVFIAYLNVAPVRVLLRDYPEISKDRARRDELLSGLLGFWTLQALAMLAVCAVLQAAVVPQVHLPGLTLLLWAMTVDFIALTLQEWIRFVYYTDFRQVTATKISFALNVARLGCYTALLLAPSLDLYSILLMATAVAIMATWAVVFQRRYRLRVRTTRRAWKRLIASLRSYGLWDHLNRSAIDTLYLVDTVILSAFGLLAYLDSYTIALKFTSMLLLVPVHLQHGLQVALANVGLREGRVRTINGFVKINAVVSLAQLAFVILAGEWLLRLLFGDIHPNAWRYTLIITVGVTVMNLGRPLMGVVNNLCSLRDAFLRIFLPGVVLGLLSYVAFAAQWGTIGVAYANIAVYAIIVAALTWFVVRRYPFRPTWWVTTHERRVLSELVQGGMGRWL